MKPNKNTKPFLPRYNSTSCKVCGGTSWYGTMARVRKGKRMYTRNINWVRHPTIRISQDGNIDIVSHQYRDVGPGVRVYYDIKRNYRGHTYGLCPGCSKKKAKVEAKHAPSAMVYRKHDKQKTKRKAVEHKVSQSKDKR